MYRGNDDRDCLSLLNSDSWWSLRDSQRSLFCLTRYTRLYSFPYITEDTDINRSPYHTRSPNTVTVPSQRKGDQRQPRLKETHNRNKTKLRGTVVFYHYRESLESRCGSRISSPRQRRPSKMFSVSCRKDIRDRSRIQNGQMKPRLHDRLGKRLKSSSST